MTFSVRELSGPEERWTGGPQPRRPFLIVLIGAAIFCALLLSHFSLLRLPYFWDEAGYYVPAARDFLLSGSLVPRSMPSSGHPPLVMVYLALMWKLFGFFPLVTRVAMLAVAAFSLTGLFELAAVAANLPVAIATVICTAIYPVFFAQSSLAHLDLAAAGLIFWGLCAYLRDRKWAAAVWFSLAVLTKETAILVPLALLAWNLLGPPNLASRLRNPWLVGLPGLVLACWYAYHYHKTGFVFGNPEFFRYNVDEPLHPVRVAIAFLMRVWQSFAHMNLYVLTMAALFAMLLPPLRGKAGERARIAPEIQFAFLAIAAVQILALSFVGGAVLARYMLPIVPLVILVSVSTLWRRVRLWWAVIAIVIVAFVAALFVNPPYGFSFEDNLAYRDYIQLHQQAAAIIEARYPGAKVLTAWPASDELTHPYLGYVNASSAVRVFRVEDFTAEDLLVAAGSSPPFDLALVFSTKYEPAHPVFAHRGVWQRWQRQFFRYHRDVPPEVAAQILGGHLEYANWKQGQWIGLIVLENPAETKDAKQNSMQ